LHHSRFLVHCLVHVALRDLLVLFEVDVLLESSQVLVEFTFDFRLGGSEDKVVCIFKLS